MNTQTQQGSEKPKLRWVADIVDANPNLSTIERYKRNVEENHLYLNTECMNIIIEKERENLYLQAH